MITCSKTYRDIPLSHRQPFHEGRCSRLHGHSWAITLTFEASELDGNGFVIDFGDLHFIENWIDEHLDHGMILSESDPREAELRELGWRVIVLWECEIGTIAVREKRLERLAEKIADFQLSSK